MSAIQGEVKQRRQARHTPWGAVPSNIHATLPTHSSASLLLQRRRPPPPHPYPTQHIYNSGFQGLWWPPAALIKANKIPPSLTVLPLRCHIITAMPRLNTPLPLQSPVALR